MGKDCVVFRKDRALLEVSQSPRPRRMHFVDNQYIAFVCWVGRVPNYRLLASKEANYGIDGNGVNNFRRD